MKIIQATFYIKEEKRDQFLTEVTALIAATRSEEGCLSYNLYESVETKNQFAMIENWEDQAAIERHNQSPLLKQLFANMADYAVKPTALSFSEPIK